MLFRISYFITVAKNNGNSKKNFLSDNSCAKGTQQNQINAHEVTIGVRPKEYTKQNNYVFLSFHKRLIFGSLFPYCV